MTHIIITLFFIALAASTNAATIYKCTDANGSLVFSQNPCAADAEVLDVEVKSSGIDVVGEGDFSRVDAGNNARARDRAIADRRLAIRSLENQRDTKISELKRQQGYANNNQAGATYRQSIAIEMQAVGEDYNSRIQAERDAIRDLQSQ